MDQSGAKRVTLVRNEISKVVDTTIDACKVMEYNANEKRFHWE
jgi:hypothetical protein